MSTTILATKLHIPTLRMGLVARPRLLEQLNIGWREGHKLTIVSAPAGYGKTTLVAEWLTSLTRGREGVRNSWLSLEEVDNDLMRFMRYFLAAFQQIDNMLGIHAQSMMGMPNLPPLANVLDELINDLAALDVPQLLVLDDYHVISNSQIHESLEYFINHQPASIHLVLTTRSDPPLPLARLRARRQMNEIRARDLRFTAEEAHAFFGLANLTLAEDAIRALDERTEGWIAGLQLAALALQHQAAPAAFIETFQGSHRYVLDYLAGEVIQQQVEEIRTFLTQTSLLTRFNADLCNTLTGRDDSQDIITRLEQSNLFIIPLDDERRWYRYHHLFADYLRSLLSKAEQAALCKKAATWHEANDLTAEAIRYSLVCGDHDFAAQVIENALEKNSTWSDGNLTQLAAWIKELPPVVIQSRPRLGLQAARISYIQGQFDQTEAQLALVEKYLQEFPTTPDAEQLLATVMLNRGAMSAVRGDFQQAIELIPPAQARIPREDHQSHARAFLRLGLAYELAGQTTQALESYLRSSSEARLADVLYLDVNGLCCAAQIQIAQGHLNLAAQTCHDAIQLARGANLPALGLAWDILGIIALERNDLTSAETCLRDGITLSRKGGLYGDLAVGLISWGRLQAYQGSLEKMQTAMDEVLSIIRSVGAPRSEQLAKAYVARFHLFLGQHEEAIRWAGEYQAIRGKPFPEFEELTLVRVLLSSKKLEGIPNILHPLLEKADAAGRMQTSLEVMILLGLSHHARGGTTAAMEWLKKSLELAAPEGYLRIFLDEGQPLRELLPHLRSTAPRLVDSILKANQPSAESRSAPLGGLPDPLSEQEVRVLKLIVEGKSNAEIAAELVISVGTAKWHVHNVLQKLGVGNRPQAIARARELGI